MASAIRARFNPRNPPPSGYPFSGPRSSAVVVRLGAGISSLAAAVVANLPSGADDSVNISPVSLQSARINPEIGAPETKLEVSYYPPYVSPF